jgi:hypothetical protein
MRSCIILTLLAVAAFGQTTSQTLYFPHADAHALQQYFNLIRSIGDIQNASSDPDNMSITVSGTTEQVSLATWLAKEVNDPPSVRPAMMRHDYPGTVPESHVVHVFYLAHTSTPQDVQELLNMTRSTADINRFFPATGISAIVARGTPDQTDMANWLLGELDQPAGALKPGHVDHAFPSDPRASLAQIYVLANTSTPQGVQEIVNGTRSLVDVQRCFPYNSRRVLTMRGTSDQIAFADWILGLLDRPASAPPDTAPHEYKYNTGWARDTATIARVFFLNVQNPQQLQQIVNEVRSATSILRAMPIVQPKAIAMRGTGDQISRAEQILKDK